jgi:anti-sigma B factor antagonist
MEQARNVVRRPPTAGGSSLHGDSPGTLTCTQQHHDGAVCLSISGELDLASLPLFRARLRSGAEATDNLVLDLRALQSIDSTGIHALLDAYQMFSLSGRRMALVAVPPRVQRVLTVFGVDEILPVFSTVDAALADFREGTRPT